MTEKTEEKKNNKSGIIVLFLLALCLGVVAGYLFQENNKLTDELADCAQNSNEIETDRDQVVGELEEMMAKYDTLSADNTEMSAELLAEKEKVETLLKEARNKNWTISKLKKETKTLRSIMKNYVHTIDSLNTMNIELKEENTIITGELTDQKKKYNELEGVKKDLADKVKIGSRLRALDLVVLPQRVKSNNVFRETSKAGKTNKIKICFTIDKNDVAKPGIKKIYARIITPDATILTCDDGDCKFNFRGSKGEYSLVRDIEYNNNELDKCFYYDVTRELPVGKYILELFSEGTDIGKVNFELN
jgi:hypothetical protein